MSDIAIGVQFDVAFFRRWIEELAGAVRAGCDELTRLDAAIGDADHGVNMRRGLEAVMDAVRGFSGTRPGPLLHLVGTRLITVVGGAAGPIYGTAFRSMAESVDGADALDLARLTAALEAGLAGIQLIGAAEPGEKTIVDAWHPAVVALRESRGLSIRTALMAAEEGARQGMVDTIPLRATKGRASYLGWRSEGHQDPGATSTYYLFAGLAAAAREGLGADAALGVLPGGGPA